VAVLFFTANAAAQSIELVGANNADVDIPAVQDAVDHNTEVILKGHFSFSKPPTVLTSLAGAGYQPATIRVWRSVSISGVSGEEDEMTTIDGGTIPFYVEAPGASVSIESLHFDHPIFDAILVYAVNGLTIRNCRFEGIVAAPGLGGIPSAVAIEINTVGTLPAPPPPGQPEAGHPENVSGRLLIVNNDIDVGGSALEDTLGILAFSVGRSPDREADVYVSGNRIANTTEPAINFRRLGGRAHIEGNVISTGQVSSLKAPVPEAIRIVNTGSYVIAHNTIDCQWTDPQAIGIGVFSQFQQWPMEHAVVMDNHVTMSPPTGTVFGNLSAGIDIRGFAYDNVVANNRIEGRAKAALSVDAFKHGNPRNNTFVLNTVDDFEPSAVDVFVGQGVTDTLLLGQEGTHSDDVTVVPLLGKRQSRE
jgi:hypothetical protein